MSSFNSLPETGFLRISEIVNVPAKGNRPAKKGLIPVSAATWWRGVGTRYPKPTKALGPNITAWAVEDLRTLIETARAHGGDA